MSHLSSDNENLEAYQIQGQSKLKEQHDYFYPPDFLKKQKWSMAIWIYRLDNSKRLFQNNFSFTSDLTSNPRLQYSYSDHNTIY